MTSYIYLNTRDRDEGSNGDAVWYTSVATLPRQGYVNIESIQFPFVMYPFSRARNNNVVYFQENNDTATTYTATINSDRNYTATELAIELSSIITAASGNGYTYTFTYNTDTGKLTITEAGNNPFRLVDGTLSANEELGYFPQDVTFKTGPFTLPGFLDVSGTKYVDVVATLGGRSSFHSASVRNVIARIPTSESFGQAVLYEPPVQSSIDITDNVLSIQMQLRDDKGYIIDLPWNAYASFALSVVAFQE